MEGAIQPKTLLRLAKSNGIKMPFHDEKSAQDFYRFKDLDHFCKIFDFICSALKTSEDFAAITSELGADSARQNIFYREVFFTYASHERLGTRWGTIVDGLSAGCKEAKHLYDVELKIIADIDRTTSPQSGVNMVELAQSSRGDFPIVGIGLDSQEVGNPPSKHRRAFEMAKKYGFHRVAHAGEEVGPEDIWEVIKILDAERIDHGVHSVESKELLAYLSKAKIPLTVCPVSNILIKIYPNMAAHPVKKLMDAGLIVTINSDDPAMFGSDLLDNYLQVANQFKFGPDEIERLALNGIKSGFLSLTEIKRREREFLKKASIARREIYGKAE